MAPIERLRQEHAVLRAKLALLDNALTVGPEAAFAIRELVYALSRRLVEHEQREDVELYPVLHETLAGPQDEFAKALAMEHEEHQYCLRALHFLTLRGARMPLEKVTKLVRELTASLREHMDREERLLFPMLERLTADREANTRAQVAGRGEAPVNETMTVNRILKAHPETKQIFACHCVDYRQEGTDCLDEVAWRHAVPVRDLLRELRAAARLADDDEVGESAEERSRSQEHTEPVVCG